MNQNKKFKELLKNSKHLTEEEVQALKNKAKKYAKSGGKYLDKQETIKQYKKQLPIPRVVGRRELLKAFVEKWNVDNDIADSPIIHEGFIDEFLKSL